MQMESGRAILSAGRKERYKKMSQDTAPDYQILALSCADTPGITAAVTGFLAAAGANIVEAKQFNDQDEGSFFMRVEYDPRGVAIDVIRDGFSSLAAQYGMHWTLRDKTSRRKVVLLVSKFDHCLGDLLYRNRIGELNMDVVAIIGNHPREALAISLIDTIPYHHFPITRDTKPQQEARIRDVVTATGAELVVLARYMQILTATVIDRYPDRVVNIHHSFLPAFSGGQPYHQAYAQGVKLIGATAHYATAHLDQGPIIEQDTARVTHRDGVADLARTGRDLETVVLARAVRLHLTDRVLVHGRKTIVF
jgi:formyltetrahydrofolate deformylase